MKNIGKKVMRGLNIIITSGGILMIIILLLSMLSGSNILLLQEDPDLLRYLITIFFILAGFTFFSFVEEERLKESKKFNWLIFWIGTSSWFFLLAGVFLLTFVFIPYIPQENFMYFLFEYIIKYNIFVGILGLMMLFLGFLSLLLSIYILRK